MRFWRRKQRQHDLEDEIQSHLAMEIQQRIERGETPQDARSNALRDFGNVALVKEVSRSVWPGALADRLTQDLRHMVRYTWNTFRKEPGPSVVTIVTLALVVAAMTFVLGWMRATMFGNRPGAHHPETLVDFVTRMAADTGLSEFLSYPTYRDLRDRSSAFSGVAAYTGHETYRMRFDSVTEGVRLAGVTGNYFDVLEVKPWMGRLFKSDDDTDAAEPVAIISYPLWRDRFKSAESIIGGRILLEGKPFTVVGVAPQEFLGTDVFREDVWLTIAKHPENSLRFNRGGRTVRVVGRLNSGVGLKAAQASVDIVTGRLEKEHGEEKRRKVQLLNRWFQSQADESLLKGLAAMCLTVLLVACANIALIGLSRALARRREIVVHLALGAPRTRIAFQILLETIGMFLPAGAMGVFAAVQAPLDKWIYLPGKPDIDAGVDARVVLFVLGITFLAAIVSGFTPAFDAARTELTRALKDESAAGGRRRLRLQNALLIAQVAVSAALLIVGGLYFRTIRYISLHRGYDPTNLQMVVLDFNIDQTNFEQRRQVAYELTGRVASLPGVSAATIAEGIPTTGTIYMNSNLRRTPYVTASDKPEWTSKSNFITPGYLEMLGIPLLKGRDFTASDTEKGQSVAIVSDSLARRLWPEGNAIGQRIFEQCGMGARHCAPEVVGIAADAVVNQTVQPLLYRPLEQHFVDQLVLAYRTSDPEEVLTSIRAIIPQLNPNVLVVESMSASGAMHSELLAQYVGIWASGILAVFAIILTSLGIYGVASYGARSRLHEIGIRTALGAQPNRIIQLVITRSVVLTAIGLALGGAAGLAVARLVPDDLGFYGVRSFDLPAYAAALLIVFATSFFAGYIPSRRAAKSAPLAVLRQE
jgi:predicted permease